MLNIKKYLKIEYVLSLYLFIVFGSLLLEKYLSILLFRSIVLGFLVLPFFYKVIGGSIKKYAIALVCFIFLVLFSSYISPYAEGIGHSEMIFHWILVLPLAVLIYYSKPSLKKLLWMLAFSALVGFTVANIDFYTGMRRSSGIHGQAIIWGDTAVVIGLLALVLSLYIEEKTYKLIAFLIFFVGIFVNVVSLSRGGFIALIVCIPIIIFLYKKKYGLKKIIPVLIVALVFFSAIFATLGSGVMDRIETGIRNVEGYLQDKEKYTDSSMGLRLEMWQSSIRAFKERPLTGVGFQQGFRNWLKQDSDYLGYKHFKHSHSEYFSMISTYGSLAALFFIIAILYFMKGTKRAGSPISVLAIFLVVIYMCHSLTESYWTSQVGSITFILISTYLLILAQLDQHSASEQVQ